jgi:methyl-accepting chemotaxis protein
VLALNATIDAARVGKGFAVARRADPISGR